MSHSTIGRRLEGCQIALAAAATACVTDRLDIAGLTWRGTNSTTPGAGRERSYLCILRPPRSSETVHQRVSDRCRTTVRNSMGWVPALAPAVTTPQRSREFSDRSPRLHSPRILVPFCLFRLRAEAVNLLLVETPCGRQGDASSCTAQDSGVHHDAPGSRNPAAPPPTGDATLGSRDGRPCRMLV